MSSTSQRGHDMARKNDDNFYRRQQEEANRLAATQNRHLNEIAKLAKSSVEEARKMRRAFEAFAEAMLGMKIEPFQLGATEPMIAKLASDPGADAPGGSYGTSSLQRPMVNRDRLPIIPEGEHGEYTPEQIAKYGEGKPYPHVDISTPGQKDRVAEHVKDARAAKLEAKRAAAREDEERARREGKARTGYGDVIEANDDFIKTEHASGKGGAELADLGLVIGVDLAQEDPAQYALIATRRAVESNDRLVILCDELTTRELLLAVEHEVAIVSNDGYDGKTTNDLQRQALVERVREKIESQRVTGEIMRVVNEASVRRARNQGSPDDLLVVVLDAAKPGEAIPLRRADLDKITPAYVLDDPADAYDENLPACGYCGDETGATGCPTHGVVIVDETPAGTVKAAIQEAIDRGEHPTPLFNIDTTPDPDGWKARLENESDEEYVERFLRLAGACNGTFRVPGVGNFIVRDGVPTPAAGAGDRRVDEVLPPGVTPKMMADHPEFAERVRSTPNYHQANQCASGGYTGVGLGENVVGGIVHQGIFSDATIPEKNARALSQYAADAERQRRDGLASY